MDDTFNYFAYGSNMLTRRLKARTPSAVAVAIGFAEGHRLTFNKLSLKDGSGKCTVEATVNAGDRVHGVLFRIDLAEQRALDRFEGLGKGYDRANIRVVLPERVCSAVTYMATSADQNLSPFDWYKDLVIGGAVEHGLPHDYVQWLRTFDADLDSDSRRAADNRALLSQR